ncbi:DNA repair protein RAD51 homolog 2 isoform X4 [Camelus bactrianus]|uniref:DNA repair protein RAD51 homolog 2 isoform X4 n=1 Tax=Camelus bactrianus TaxID=9837 RepID=A0AC58QGN1_CAMBA
MGSKKLRRVGLSQELCDRLNRHQIVTCQDFLCLSPMELMKMTGLSYQGVQELLCVVSRACAPRMQTEHAHFFCPTAISGFSLDIQILHEAFLGSQNPDQAYEMKTQRSAAPSPAFLSTTLSALDAALHGGVACGSLTEITGPPGCGKTQFCIMMSILATLPTNMGGLEGAVVYIDTESAFSAERLVEIAESRFPRYFNNEEKLLLTSSKVHLYRELTCDEVLQRIQSLEEEIISKGVKLVIIDSVASVVRKEFDTQLQGNLRERNKFLAREAASLKYLAEEFSIPPMTWICFLEKIKNISCEYIWLLPRSPQLQRHPASTFLPLVFLHLSGPLHKCQPSNNSSITSFSLLLFSSCSPSLPSAQPPAMLKGKRDKEVGGESKGGAETHMKSVRKKYESSPQRTHCLL